MPWQYSPPRMGFPEDHPISFLLCHWGMLAGNISGGWFRLLLMVRKRQYLHSGKRFCSRGGGSVLSHPWLRQIASLPNGIRVHDVVYLKVKLPCAFPFQVSCYREEMHSEVPWVLLCQPRETIYEEQVGSSVLLIPSMQQPRARGRSIIAWLKYTWLLKINVHCESITLLQMQDLSARLLWPIW